jgi:TatD DNase family protein
MLLADAHCHLDPRYFEEGAQPIIDRAVAQGVVGLVVVGLADQNGIADARPAVDLAERLPERVTACVGIHPHEARHWSPALHAELRALASRPSVASVGEIGLDYHYSHSPHETQREVFARLIGLARELRKPIVVHTRAAKDDTLAILKSEGAREVGGVIHCFSEDREFAREVLDLGFVLSFSGIVTFKNAHAVKDVATWAPLESILLETDSPYLAPVPLRGKRCEPAYVAHTARFIAEARGLAAEVLSEAALSNTERVFGRTFARGGGAE